MWYEMDVDDLLGGQPGCFRCLACQRAFVRATEARKHIKLHVRPFKCNVCSLRFSEQRDLDRHVSGHAGYIAVRCSCGRTFSRYDNYRRHAKRSEGVHDIVPLEGPPTIDDPGDGRDEGGTSREDSGGVFRRLTGRVAPYAKRGSYSALHVPADHG
jgi:uncharacterized C2H2 Zn-finger protein